MARRTLFIRNVVWDLKQIHIRQRYAHVLGLSARKAAGEVGIAKHAGRAPPVHGLGRRVGVGLLALRRQLLLAKEAVAAGNLERGDVAAAGLDTAHTGPDAVDNAAELVAEYVALGQLDDGAVQEMQVGAADCAARDFKDDVAVLDDLGTGDVG